MWSIPDAGLFYDSVNINTNTHLHKENFKNLIAFSNAEIDPPVPECITKFPDSKENCMLAQNLYEHIRFPNVCESVFIRFLCAHSNHRGNMYK